MSCHKNDSIPRLMVMDYIKINQLPNSVTNNPINGELLIAFGFNNRASDESYGDYINENRYTRSNNLPISVAGLVSNPSSNKDYNIIDDYSHKVLSNNGIYYITLFHATHIRTDQIGIFRLDFNEIRTKYNNTNKIHLKDGQTSITLDATWIY